jgi:hypothetical protein
MIGVLPMRPLLASCLLGAACAVAPEAVPQDPLRPPGIARYQPGQGQWGERVSVDLIALPAVWLQPDVPNRLQPGDDADVATGPGFALRGAVGNKDQSIGVLYQGAFLEDDETDADVDLHGLYLDFDVSMRVGDGPRQLLLHAGAGLGMGALDFDDPRFGDVTTGALNLRVDFEFAPTPAFSLLAGIGGFFWGYPGETDAYGSFLELGGRFCF